MEPAPPQAPNIIRFREFQRKQLETMPDEAANEKPTQSPTDRLPISVWKTIAIGLVTVSVLGAGFHFGYQTYAHLSTHEETDDAYITGHLHQVSSRENGTVEQVLVDDNEHVNKGQPLVILDSRDYKAKYDQAVAKLSQAEQHALASRASITFQDVTAKGQDTDARGSIDNALAGISRSQAEVREAKAGIESAKADLAAKEAELVRAQADYRRFDVLEKEGAISTSSRDSAKRDYLVAVESRNAARDAVTQVIARFEQAQQKALASQAELTKAQAQKQLAHASAVQTKISEQQYQTDLSAIASARAEVEEARLNLSYTRILAPTSGRIGRKTVEEGHRVEPGQPLLTIVGDEPWVVANYKETQLKNMRAGQKVEVRIDSFPNHVFEGTVQSFSPASGSSFSLLPSDNATGNFTKIVQRVPVKVVFTRESIKGYEDRLAPGLSVVTSVDVSKTSPLQHSVQIAESRR